MNMTTWLFLYLAGLMEAAIRYRLSLRDGWCAVLILLPLALLGMPRPKRPSVRWLGLLITLGCSIAFARSVSMDFWDTERLDLAFLIAGIGLGAWLCVRESRPDSAWQVAEWLMVSLGWLLALWNPFAPWMALAPAAALALWSPLQAVPGNTSGLSPSWLLFWIGMAVSKPWWDSDTWGALGVALWALAVAITCLPRIRALRPPLPLASLALVPLLYPWLPVWIWAPLLGLLTGWALQRSARPWHRAAGYALLGGLLLSYGLHSNLQWFGPWVWGRG
jgi:hypothetical protein